MNRVPAPAPDRTIELRSWRQFLTLAQTLHFGRAAQQLNMTQPPLTLAIQQLERRLGTALFDRTRRSVALTPVGAQLVEPVRQLLDKAASLSAHVRDAAAGEVGRVRLGFISTVGFGPLPAWLREFRERSPGITIELIEATSDVQLQALDRGEIDAGFLLHAPGLAPEAAGRPSGPPMQRLSLGLEPLVLALPDPGVGSRRRPLRTAQWLAEPLVIFPRSATPSLYDAILACYQRQGVSPRIVQEATQMQTIVNLVSAGLGLALVPKSVTQLQRPGVVYQSLPRSAAFAALRCETSLLWPREAAPAVLRFVACVSALAAASAPVTERALRYRSP
jgi:DNA-binding transcriptional LysR family regulator